METRTDGQRALQAVISAGRSIYSVAAELQVGRAVAGKWLQGSQRPTPPFRKAIERLFGIPADDWLTDEERLIAFGGGSEGGGSGAVEHGGGSSCAV